MLLIFGMLMIPATGWQGTSATAQSTELKELKGNWVGTLKINEDTKLRWGIQIIRKADGTFGANLANIDQGVPYIPVASTSLKNNNLKLTLNVAPLTIEGILSGNKETIDGTFSMGGRTEPINFKKVSKLPSVQKERSQTPKPPFPYQQEEVNFHNQKDDIWLSGILTKPEGKGPFPAIIFLAGSGQQDRNYDVKGHKPAWVIADYLTQQGFAVLRYDKRGVYKSTGNYENATKEDFSRDALSAYRYLSSREDVYRNKTGFIGHSEGSQVAARAAAFNNGEAGFIVSMAGVGLPLTELLVLQDGTQAAAKGATEHEIELIRDFSRKYYQTAMKAESVPSRKKALQILYKKLEGEQKKVMEKFYADRPGTLNPDFAARNSFFEDLRQPSPVRYWEKIKSPVLVLNGGKDSQVPAEENVSAIVNALNETPTDKHDSNIFPDKNHMFQNAKTGATDEYGKIDQTIAPDVLEYINDWLNQVK